MNYTYLSCPTFAIKTTVLDSFGKMFNIYFFAGSEVGNGAVSVVDAAPARLLDDAVNSEGPRFLSIPERSRVRGESPAGQSSIGLKGRGRLLPQP